MSFTDLQLKKEYRSLVCNVVDSFYTPVLSEAVLYKRAVGFFSSSALISLTEGIGGLIRNGGRIELVASPRLSEEDLDAIRDGFDRRDEVVKDCLIRELKEPQGKFEEARLNLLSNLIASGILTLKIALLESGNEIGMFHEKLGLVFDRDDNVIAFSGSMNESANAFHTNYESFDVYTSWGADADRVIDKQAAFSAMWGDFEPGLRVVEFPEVNEAILKKYQVREDVDLTDLEVPRPGISKGNAPASIPAPMNVPRVPSWVVMRDYQKNAIAEWEKCGYRGIFDMATGTGKTYTALAAVATLSQVVDDKLAVVIVCPYQHLVEQWREDIIAFGMRPIVCYSASNQKNWRDRVKNSVMGFMYGGVDRFCIVTTNATFATKFMQEQMAKLDGHCLVVADEAHNFGAEKQFKSLPQQFKYRLALSATIERHGDDAGTERIFSYFGEKCIEYTLEDAISSQMLTPYYYHPVVVSLDEEELDEYLDLTKRIGKAVASGSAGDLSDYAKMLLIERARIVAGAKSKLSALKHTIEPFKNDNHMLVYCGATTVQDEGYEEGCPDVSEERQIDLVSKMLGTELGMKVSQFTSREDAAKRELLKEEFTEGKQMQALIAIRCLDEGVNIPNIEKAFILASSTNPKEYVQRRGRVLRLAEGKRFAVIYDFVTLPMSIEELYTCSAEVSESSKSLAIREIARMRDFARISENPTESLELVGELIEAFGINPEEEEGRQYV